MPLTDILKLADAGIPFPTPGGTPAAGGPASPLASAVDDQPVRCAALPGQNVPLTGSTITVIDSVTLAVGTRVGLWQQANKLENGIYVATQVTGIAGAVTTNFMRAPDAQNAQQLCGYKFAVEAGSQAGASFVVQGDPSSVVVGTSPILIGPSQQSPTPISPATPNSTAPTNGASVFNAPADHNHPVPPRTAVVR